MKSEKLKVFVSAYACEPNLGSEIGVGWNWVLQMANYFELWVLTRKSNQKSIEAWFKEQNIKCNIHFIYWDLPPKLRFWKRGLKGVRTYYNLWQKMTNSIVKKTMIENDIHIYHLLTYGNSLWPASKYGMSQFFIWGPTGGVDSIPLDYVKFYNGKWRFVETLRRVMVKTLPLNYGFQQRCKNANLIFCKSYSMLENIPEGYRDKAMLFTDVAVDTKDLNDYLDSNSSKDELIRYLVVGRLDAWRGFDILIEAFSNAVKGNRNVRLEILGKGSDYDRLSTLINKWNMNEYINMTGQVPMIEYYKKMANCDVIVNPSLKEGAVTTAFDSLSFGKPLIGIDTGGYTRYFKPEYSIIIPRKSRSETINMLTKAITEMTKKDFRESMGSRAMKAGIEFTWTRKGKEIYEAIVEAQKLD
jgi:glycosyltransferase involved in cell wall biosynthesis